MWQAIELRELRLFLTLAEELHFGRTAESLQLTPSRVSQSLRELEAKLGAQLVHRTSRTVKLTPFGEEFLGGLRPALEGLDAVLEATDTSVRSLAGTLRLGVLSGPAGGPRLLKAVDAFESQHPACKVDLSQKAWEDPVARLREGEVDVMATWVPLGQPDLVVGPTLSRQRRVLAVARDHPLAERDSIDIEELADHPVGRVESWPKDLREAVVPAKTPRGRRIRGVGVGVGDQAPLDLPVRIARRELVLPTVETAGPYMGNLDLAYVPITGMKPLRSALVWRRPARDPKLRAFIRVARDVLKSDV
jgi:DNA-binding transcriptional LysR family regulator